MGHDMTVKDIKDLISNYLHFDIPEIEFQGEMFPFIVIGEFMILGPEQIAGEMREQLDRFSDDFELITAIRMRVTAC